MWHWTALHAYEYMACGDVEQVAVSLYVEMESAVAMTKLVGRQMAAQMFLRCLQQENCYLWGTLYVGDATCLWYPLNYWYVWLSYRCSWKRQEWGNDRSSLLFVL